MIEMMTVIMFVTGHSLLKSWCLWYCIIQHVKQTFDRVHKAKSEKSFAKITNSVDMN